MSHQTKGSSPTEITGTWSGVVTLAEVHLIEVVFEGHLKEFGH